MAVLMDWDRICIVGSKILGGGGKKKERVGDFSRQGPEPSRMTTLRFTPTGELKDRFSYWKTDIKEPVCFTYISHLVSKLVLYAVTSQDISAFSNISCKLFFFFIILQEFIFTSKFTQFEPNW